MSRLPFIIIFTAFSMLFLSCSDSGTHYYINEPSDVTIIDDVFKCDDGTVSYAAFVANNDNDGRIVLINGCKGEVLKSFEGFDGETGVYTGKDPSAVRIISRENGEYVLVTASSTNRRATFTPLKADFSLMYKESIDASGKIIKTPDQTTIGLDFYPLTIAVYGDDVVISGSDSSGKGVLQFFDISGSRKSSFNGDFYFQALNCKDTLCYAIDKKSGSIFTFTSGTEPVAQIFNSDEYENSGFKDLLFLKDKRLIVWNDKSFFLIDENFAVRELYFPFKWKIEHVFAVSYKERKYLPVTKDNFEDTINIDPNDYTDNDETSTEGEYETSDSDIVYDFKQAEDSETLWLSSSTGRIFAYNLSDDSWMVSNTGFAPYSYLSSYKNIDKIKSLKAKRYYYQSVYYRIGWEDTYKNSVSNTGKASETSVVDDNAYFDNYTATSETAGDKIVLLPDEEKDTSSCFGQDHDMTFDILSVNSKNDISVSFGDAFNKIESCYGENINYALFPKNAYNVKRTEWNYRYSEKPARELNDSLKTYSYSDDYMNIELNSPGDDLTPDNSYLTFKLKFYAPYVGYNTTVYYSKAFMLSSGNVLLFSPSDELLLEYNPNDDSQINVYR